MVSELQMKSRSLAQQEERIKNLQKELEMVMKLEQKSEKN